MKSLLLFSFSDALPSSAALLAAGCRLSNVHGDNMVLQRAPQTTTLFGFAPPGTVVTTTFRSTNLTTTATALGEWRQPLPATPASPPSAGGEAIAFACSTGEAFALRNVLFGDVVLCGGQSNMQFTVKSIGDAPGWNASAEIAAADAYPGVRTMTVGQVFSSASPLDELGAPPTLPWSVASAATIGCGDWNCTSAVCWFYGRALFDALQVPIGLLSSNWGGTTIPSWSTNETNAACGFPPPPRRAPLPFDAPSKSDQFAAPAFVAARVRGEIPNPNAGYGVLYNAMIYPFTKGPLTLSNIIWFQVRTRPHNAQTAPTREVTHPTRSHLQGESDLIDNFNSYEAAYSPIGFFLPISTYACQQKALIAAWRGAFASPGAYFGFVSLEPWSWPPPGATSPLVEFRMAQLQALALPNVGYASGVDIGDSTGPFGSIHPRAKRVVGARLAAAALDLNYGRGSAAWRGPTFKSQSVAQARGVITVRVALDNVPTTLKLLQADMPGTTPFCQVRGGAVVAPSGPALCAWFTLFGDGGEVLNATSVALSEDQRGLVLQAEGKFNALESTQFGWGVWPVNTVYSAEGFPLQPWWCNVAGACF